jgi:hypothetical protein
MNSLLGLAYIPTLEGGRFTARSGYDESWRNPVEIHHRDYWIVKRFDAALCQ